MRYMYNIEAPASVPRRQRGGALIVSIVILVAVALVTSALANLVTGRAETSSRSLDNSVAFYAADTATRVHPSEVCDPDEDPEFFLDGSSGNVSLCRDEEHDLPDDLDIPGIRFYYEGYFNDSVHATSSVIPIDQLTLAGLTQLLDEKTNCIDPENIPQIDEEVCHGDPLWSAFVHILDPQRYNPDERPLQITVEYDGDPEGDWNRLEIPAQFHSSLGSGGGVIFGHSVTFSVDLDKIRSGIDDDDDGEWNRVRERLFEEEGINIHFGAGDQKRGDMDFEGDLRTETWESVCAVEDNDGDCIREVEFDSYGYTRIREKGDIKPIHHNDFDVEEHFEGIDCNDDDVNCNRVSAGDIPDGANLSFSVSDQTSGWTNLNFKGNTSFSGDVKFYNPAVDEHIRNSIVALSDEGTTSGNHDRLRFATTRFGGDVYFGQDVGLPEVDYAENRHVNPASGGDSGIDFGDATIYSYDDLEFRDQIDRDAWCKEWGSFLGIRVCQERGDASYLFRGEGRNPVEGVDEYGYDAGELDWVMDSPSPEEYEGTGGEETAWGLGSSD